MQHRSLARIASSTDCRPAPRIVCLDADNTLWDTDGVFAAAQIALLANVASSIGIDTAASDRLSFVREIDQELAARHHLGLRYPPKLLITALYRRLLGDDAVYAARRAWSDPSEISLAPAAINALEQDYLSKLGAIPQLLSGVGVGLKKLNGAGATLVVVTEGGRQRVHNTLRANEIDGYIARIIDAPKGKELFVRLKRLFGGDAAVFMIGDQLTRDIVPAAEAGLEAIHVPGKFRPAWEIGVSASGSRQAETFEQAADMVLEHT